MNDVDWWAGETGEECMEAMQEFSGYAKEEIEEMIDDGYPCPVSETDLDRLTYIDTESTVGDSGEHVKRSFREELKRLVEAEEKFPCFFASTEW